MKKRIVALVLAVLTLVLALGFAGCKKNDKTDWDYIAEKGELVIDGEGEVVLDFQVVGNRVGYGSPAEGPNRDIGIQATSPIDSEFDFRMLMTAFGGNQLREKGFWRNADGILDCVITALQGLVVELRPRYHIRGLRMPHASSLTAC